MVGGGSGDVGRGREDGVVWDAVVEVRVMRMVQAVQTRGQVHATSRLRGGGGGGVRMGREEAEAGTEGGSGGVRT